jgi:hypothetical protein
VAGCSRAVSGSTLKADEMQHISEVGVNTSNTKPIIKIGKNGKCRSSVACAGCAGPVATLLSGVVE